MPMQKFCLTNVVDLPLLKLCWFFAGERWSSPLKHIDLQKVLPYHNNWPIFEKTIIISIFYKIELVRLQLVKSILFVSMMLLSRQKYSILNKYYYYINPYHGCHFLICAATNMLHQCNPPSSWVGEGAYLGAQGIVWNKCWGIYDQSHNNSTYRKNLFQ